MQFLGCWSLEANGTVNPRRELGLRCEIRLRHVLAPGPREFAVDHYDFAVIAEVDPGKQGANRVGGKGIDDGHAARSHLLAEVGLEECLASHRVDEDSALDTPSGGLDQGLADFDARRIIEPDEELEMTMLLGRLDVGLESAENQIRIAEELDFIAEDRARIADEFGESCDAKRCGIERCDGARAGVRIGVDFGPREGVDDPAMPRDSFAAESSLTDQQVDDAPGDRDRKEEDDPAEPRRWFDAPTAENHDDQTDSKHKLGDDQYLADKVRRTQKIENVFKDASSFLMGSSTVNRENSCVDQGDRLR